MELKSLLDGAGIDHRADGSENIEISEIVSDSRRVRQNCLFVCIRGMKNDSHRYIDDVCAAGAAAVVVEDDENSAMLRIPAGVTIIYTKDTRAALARLWCARYELSATGGKMRLVAVTGTNGKTTVSYMLRAIFGAAMYRCGLIGTVRCETPLRVLDTRCDPAYRADDPNANMTTPDPDRLYRMLAAMRDDGAEYVFIEASSHALALRKLEPLRFACAVFTNLTPEHLDLHGNMGEYFAAKARLLELSDAAVINADDPYGERFAEYATRMHCPCAEHLIMCGEGNGISKNKYRGYECYRAESIRDRGRDGVSYMLCSPHEMRDVRCAVPGRFNVMNSLEAAACALYLGVSGGFVADALSSLSPAPGRLERVRLGGDFPAVVFIDYAHTPDALSNLLKTARGFTNARSECRGENAGRIILVFGCGGDRDRKKRPLMGEVASRLADITLITSDNSRSEDPLAIIEEINAGMSSDAVYENIPDRRRAIERAVNIAERGDVILLAGKGHERYEIVGGVRREFDEAAVVIDAVERRMRKKEVEDKYGENS